jgi:hypothetical protein
VLLKIMNPEHETEKKTSVLYAMGSKFEVAGWKEGGVDKREWENRDVDKQAKPDAAAQIR